MDVQPASVSVLRKEIIIEILSAFNLPRSEFWQKSIGPWFDKPATRFSEVFAKFDQDIASFANAPLLSQWQLIKMPTAPLLRLELVILDNPTNPYKFESFLNIVLSSSVTDEDVRRSPLTESEREDLTEFLNRDAS